MSRLRILFSGMVAGDPEQGGASWSILQYVLGLRALGHEVRLVEPVDRLEPVSSRYFDRLVRDFGLLGEAALLVRGSEETAGVSYRELVAWAGEADVLFNVSGMLRDEHLVAPPPLRVYLDLDPAFNQLWHAQGIDMGFDLHNRFATVGLELGEPGCAVPTCGRDWIKTLPPVVLPRWQRATAIDTDAFTTVGNWRGYGSVEQDGRRLRPEGALAARAAGGAGTDGRAAGPGPQHPSRRGTRPRGPASPRLGPARPPSRSPAHPVATPSSSAARRARSASPRRATSCPAAAGSAIAAPATSPPAARWSAQDTGFRRHLPTGEGLLAFTTAEEAAGAIDEIAADYDRHAKAARALAADLLDSRLVLPRLLDRLASTSDDLPPLPGSAADTVS